VKINKISYYKGFKRAHINFQYDGREISKIIYLKILLKKIGNYETIIFSSRNPYIVKSKVDYEENFK
jgi:hypothetical protein